MSSKIYTKTGDCGETSLVGGKRIKKFDVRVEAYGTVDELNAAVGAALPWVQDEKTKEALIFLMHKLFNCASNTATPPEAGPAQVQILQADITYLEQAIDWMDEAAGPICGFILPTGTPATGLLHLARTICRRAERHLVHLAESEPVDKNVMIFLNRASDFLFAAARIVECKDNGSSVFWDPTAPPPR